jgi:hypothetical protein
MNAIELHIGLFLFELVLALFVLTAIFSLIGWINEKLGTVFAYLALIIWIVGATLLLTYLV